MKGVCKWLGTKEECLLLAASSCSWTVRFQWTIEVDSHPTTTTSWRALLWKCSLQSATMYALNCRYSLLTVKLYPTPLTAQRMEGAHHHIQTQGFWGNQRSLLWQKGIQPPLLCCETWMPSKRRPNIEAVREGLWRWRCAPWTSFIAFVFLTICGLNSIATTAYK